VAYEGQKAYTRQFLGVETLDTGKLNSVDGYKQYSRLILNNVEQYNDITDKREQYDFRFVGENYKLIPDNAVKVYIYSGKRRKELFDKIHQEILDKNKISKHNMRILRQNSISLFRTKAEVYVKSGEIERLTFPKRKNLNGDPVEEEEVLYRWVGGYNSVVGIKAKSLIPE